MGVILMDAGLAVTFVGLVCLVRPLRFLGLSTRPSAAVVVVSGLALIVAAVLWPAPLRRSPSRTSLLDDFLPAWQFAEHHEIRVHAPPEKVDDAIRKVTASEITLFRTLTWLRAPRLPWSRRRASILNPAAERPILDVATSSGFAVLADDPGREIVFGTLVVVPERPDDSWREGFAQLDRPGYAKAAMSFSVTDAGNGWSHLTTETRVYATDASARRRFAAYWRVIYPGSSFIRRMWLEAIRRRAER